jgi:hypothetical protein
MQAEVGLRDAHGYTAVELARAAEHEEAWELLCAAVGAQNHKEGAEEEEEQEEEEEEPGEKEDNQDTEEQQQPYTDRLMRRFVDSSSSAEEQRLESRPTVESQPGSTLSLEPGPQPEPEPQLEPEPEPEPELEPELELELEPELEPEPEPEPMRLEVAPESDTVFTELRYRALAPAIIRAGPDHGSKKVGQLVVGSEISVLQQSQPDNANSPVRVRCKEGWISVTSKSGRQLLETINADATSFRGENKKDDLHQPKPEHGPETKSGIEHESRHADDATQTLEERLRLEREKQMNRWATEREARRAAAEEARSAAMAAHEARMEQWRQQR